MRPARTRAEGRRAGLVVGAGWSRRMAGECGPRAGVGARVRMIRMPAPPNTAPAGCDFDAELLAERGAVASRTWPVPSAERYRPASLNSSSTTVWTSTTAWPVCAPSSTRSVVRRCPSSRPAAHRDTDRHDDVPPTGRTRRGRMRSEVPPLDTSATWAGQWVRQVCSRRFAATHRRWIRLRAGPSLPPMARPPVSPPPWS
jgi:hypothetical protein